MTEKWLNSKAISPTLIVEVIAKKLILLALITVGGCSTEQPTWKFTPGKAQVSAPENGSDLSEDLKRQVAEGKVELAEATRIEKERRADRARQVQNALDRIKKAEREEYAANRPTTIKASILKEQLCLGMDDKDVLVCLGQPQSKSRRVSVSGDRETWVYSKLSVWFEGGVVTGWQEEK